MMIAICERLHPEIDQMNATTEQLDTFGYKTSKHNHKQSMNLIMYKLMHAETDQMKTKSLEWKLT